MKFNNQTLIILLAAAGVGYWLYTNKKKGDTGTSTDEGSGGGGGGVPLPPIFPDATPPAPVPTITRKITPTSYVNPKLGDGIKQTYSAQQVGMKQSADPNKLSRVRGVSVAGDYTPTGTGGNVSGLPPSGFSSGVFGGFTGKEPLTINNILM